MSVQMIKRLYRRILRRPAWDDPLEVVPLDGEQYLGKYASHGDRNALRSPEDAPGGFWSEIGALQFCFLFREGLRPSHRLLDVGCSTLRAGRWLIRYLDPSCYTGLDISPESLRLARRLVRLERLVSKRPQLILTDGSLTFTALAGQRFDVILAQSVFTHLPDQLIEECFAHVDRVMTPAGRFYFTAWVGDVAERTQPYEFRQTLPFYQEMAGRYGFRLDERSADYPHPRQQRMFRGSRAGAP